MRATSPAQPAAVSDAVWDELKAGHVTPLTYGKMVNDIENIMNVVYADYGRRTAYAYSGALANGATYVPAAGTLISSASLVDGSAAKLELMTAAQRIKVSPAAGTGTGFTGPIYCDGTRIGFKNVEGNPQNLELDGITI